MTPREIIEVSEQKLRILSRAGGRCEVCGDPLDANCFQAAHRIPKAKWALRKYGPEVIHHEANLAATCGLRCNAAVLVSGLAEEELAEKIRRRRER